MKKFILLLALISALSFTLQADHITKGNKAKGDWLTGSFWNNNTYAPVSSNGKVDVTINSTDTILLGRNLGPFGTHFQLTVNSSSYLKVTGDMIVENHLKIDVKPNATFIIEGDLILKNHAKVTINGAMQVDNIIGDKHNSITGNGTLHLMDSNSGANISSGVTVTNDPILDPLPVELLSFTGQVSGQDIELNWVTASEINNRGFEVQRLDEISGMWDVIGFVDGNYNHNGILNYSFTDMSPLNGVNYYRLRQVDYDGAYQYYGPVAVNFGNTATDEFSLKIIRTTDKFRVVLAADQHYQIQVFDLRGNILFTAQADNSISFPVTGQAVIVRVSNSFGQSVSQTVM